MRLMYLINNLKLGGAERRVLDLINGLSPDFSLALACLQFTGELVPELRRKELVRYDLNVGGEDQFWGGITRLCDALDDFKPSLLHTNLVQASLLGRIAALHSTIPVVSTQHHAFHVKNETQVYRLERSTWLLSRGFVALSFAIKRTLRGGGYSGPIQVIPTGIEVPSDVAEPPRTRLLKQPYIMSVGQFRDGQKGHDLLVGSFKRLVKEFADYKLYFVGDGPERSRVEALTDAAGLAESVVFLGERTDVMNLMRGCTVFVLASRWEGFGRVLLEAMSLGCAVVATSVEGIPEIISSGHNGFLVPLGDTEQLADAIAHCLRSQEVRQTLGSAARESVRKRFSLTRMLDREARFYSLVLRKHV